jgi:protein involved in polysaccharide export with SLBB domain
MVRRSRPRAASSSSWSRSAVRSTAAVFAALAFASCTATGDPMPEMAPKINQTLRGDSDMLVPGDVLEVRFGDLGTDAKVWDHEALVRPEGKAAFLGLGDKPVSGLTLDAVRAALAAEYQKQFGLKSTDKFGLLVKTKVPRNVIVMGEVKTPGSVVFEGSRMTLLEAIGRAGGFLKETAKLESLLLVRWDPDTRQQTAFRIDADLEYWSSPVPVYLQPFDVVYIPNTAIDKVDIWVDQYFRRLLPIPINVAAVNATPK